MSDPFSQRLVPLRAASPNPMRAAQAGMKPALPKRFYKDAGVEERDGAFHLTLDGRAAKTPGRHAARRSDAARLAEAMAEEWARQGDEIDPATMPITRLVNSAIDGVSARTGRGRGRSRPLRGLGPRLLPRQRPGRGWPRRRTTAGLPFSIGRGRCTAPGSLLGEGVMHVAQPEEAIAAIRAALEEVRSPFALAALHVMTTLTGLGPDRARACVRRAERRTRPGKPPMWTSSSRKASGARTTRPWSGGGGARRISGRLRGVSPRVGMRNAAALGAGGT